MTTINSSMKKIIICSLLLLSNMVCAPADDFDDVIEKSAEECFCTKEYSKGVRVCEVAKKVRPKMNMYQAACLAALDGDKDKAFKWLNDVITRKYNNGLEIMANEDLSSLHSDKRWDKLLKRIRKADMLPEDVETAVLMVGMSIKDQSARRDFLYVRNRFGVKTQRIDSAGRAMSKVDRHNRVVLDSVFAAKGFLGIKEIGEAGSLAVFYIIQHSNKEMIGRYLPAFREAVAKGNAKASQLAYMEDRYAQMNGKKQIYGTQADWSKKHGAFVISKGGIENPESVNERRLSVGLNTLEDYAKKEGYLIIE